MEFFGDVTGSDPYKPSLFELVAQEQLRDLLQPAMKYVLSVFATRYPRYLIRIVNRHEEFYALIMFFVERRYLQKEGASFAENFYGLKRRRKPLVDLERTTAALGGPLPEEKLTRKDVWRSLVFLIGVPYLRAKAQDYYEQLGGGVDADILEEGTGRAGQRNLDLTFAARLRRAFKAIYPYANVTYEVLLLGYNMAFLFEKTAHYRPWLAWMGLDLRRLGPHDYHLENTQAPPTESRQSALAIIRRLLLTSPRLLLDSLKVLLPLSIFFVKFLEWWYSPTSPARSLATAPKGPPVPPPRMLPPHPNGIQVKHLKYGQCPLCQRNLENATALPSGYVFCYRCIHKYVDEHQKCPVTLLPARVWQLRKVLV